VPILRRIILYRRLKAITAITIASRMTNASQACCHALR
jgi:hypothetical protein